MGDCEDHLGFGVSLTCKTHGIYEGNWHYGCIHINKVGGTSRNGSAEKLSTLQQMVSKRAAFQCTVFQKIKQCQKEERTQKVILPLSKTMASPSFENCAEGSASPSQKG